MLTVRWLVGLLGGIGFLVGAVVAFREHAATALVLASTLLIVVALLFDRLEGVKATVAGNEISFPLRAVADSARALRAIADQPAAQPDLEAIVTRLEKTLTETLVAGSTLDLGVGTPMRDGVEDTGAPRTIDLIGYLSLRDPSTIRAIQVQMSGDNGHLDATVPYENQPGFQYLHELGQLPPGQYLALINLVLSTGDRVPLRRIELHI